MNVGHVYTLPHCKVGVNNFMEGRVRLELTYDWITASRLNQLGHRPLKVVGEVGLEPTPSWFQTRPEIHFRTPR